MINWKAYPQNKPEQTGDYLVWIVAAWRNGRVGTAYWNGDMFTDYPWKYDITHFTEINPPSEPINQDSVYGC